jgi:hypothetical protein
MTTSAIKVGQVYYTGGFINKRNWVVDKISDHFVFLSEIIWSADMVKEPNCARRNGVKVRVKIGAYLVKKPEGPFELRQPPITVLE